MRFGWVSSALVCAAMAMVSAQASASIVFSSSLDGASERPDPVTGTGAGSATAMLSGDAGGFVLTYTLNYAGLSSDAVAGHIHYSILPPGRDPAEQTGPVVHPLEADFGFLGADGTVSGEWRYDDAALPLTDALADSLLDGELYFNLHTTANPEGEIRGQLLAVAGAIDTGAGNATALPLPAPLLLGLFGLTAAGWAARRGRRVAR